MKFIVCISLAFTFILIAMVHIASADEEKGNEVFLSIDTNHDGKVSREEFKDKMKKDAFSRIDTNHNSEIALSEWQHINNVTDSKNHQQLFQTIDKDRNKRITFLEFSDYAEKHSNIDDAFMNYDKDKNNSLSPDEISSRPLFRIFNIKF